MGFRQTRVNHQRFSRQFLSLAKTLLWRKKAKPTAATSTIRQAGICRGIVWVFLKAATEKLCSLAESVTAAFVPVVPALQVSFVGVRINDVDPGQMCLLLRSEFDMNLTRDSPSDLCLQSQDIAKITLVAFRPEMSVHVSINYLCGDAHAIPCAQHGSFDDGFDL